jgi:O-antigen chain-terminating methyltransferase
LQRLQDLIVGSSDAIEGKITAHESATYASLGRVAESLDSMTARVAAKVDRPEVEALEQRIHSEGDLRRAQLTAQLETLERRLQSEMNAKLTHVEAVTKKINAELTALRSLVEALEQWTAEQPSGALLRETIEVAAAAKAHAGRIADELATLHADAGRLDIGLATVRADTGLIDAKLTGLDQHLLVYRQNLLEQERRLGILLEDFSKRPPGILKAGQSVAVRSERDHLFDGFYVSFEDTFRGTREDIKRRVEIYLPYVREAGAGTAKAPVLDIGCGRGEWLELLRDNGLAASGVDLNRITAAHCRERGLVVAEADGLDYLRGLKASSVGAVTAIHVIEHVPFRQLMFLFDEVRRVLKPGGVAIFETPNPENLIVGACNFWYDPTHQHPLPPEPMRFILDSRGFTRVEILRLHPSTEMSPLTEVPNELPTAIAERFYGPQDYALIGYKS